MVFGTLICFNIQSGALGLFFLFYKVSLWRKAYTPVDCWPCSGVFPLAPTSVLPLSGLLLPYPEMQLMLTPWPPSNEMCPFCKCPLTLPFVCLQSVRWCGAVFCTGIWMSVLWGQDFGLTSSSILVHRVGFWDWIQWRLPLTSIPNHFYFLFWDRKLPSCLGWPQTCVPPASLGFQRALPCQPRIVVDSVDE